MVKSAIVIATVVGLFGLEIDIRANEVPSIIFDTDMVEDYDDVGALAALHALADEDRCEILATVSCTRGNQSVATVEVINAYYGRKDIPIR